MYKILSILLIFGIFEPAFVCSKSSQKIPHKSQFIQSDSIPELEESPSYKLVERELIDTIIMFDPETFEETITVVKNIKVDTIRIEGPVKKVRRSNEEPPPPPSSSETPEVKEIFRVVESMPRFPGCEHVGVGMKEVDKCAREKLLHFVYENLKYPEKAKEFGIEGTVVVQFVVQADGIVSNVNVVRDVGQTCPSSVLLGDEVFRVVNLMNEMDERWIPGKQNGKNVDVQFTLPVIFNNPEAKPVFTMEDVDEMPRFPGCEQLGAGVEELTSCAFNEMLNFIYKDLSYPSEARKNGIEGKVVAQIVINKYGRLSQIEILKGIGAGCDEELERVLNEINCKNIVWIPGKVKDQKVNVSLSLPIQFSLE